MQSRKYSFNYHYYFIKFRIKWPKYVIIRLNTENVNFRSTTFEEILREHWYRLPQTNKTYSNTQTTSLRASTYLNFEHIKNLYSYKLLEKCLWSEIKKIGLQIFLWNTLYVPKNCGYFTSEIKSLIHFPKFKKELWRYS